MLQQFLSFHESLANKIIFYIRCLPCGVHVVMMFQNSRNKDLKGEKILHFPTYCFILHIIHLNISSQSYKRSYYNSVAMKHHNVKVINNYLNACFNLTNSVSFVSLGLSGTDKQIKYSRKDIPTTSELKLVTGAMQDSNTEYSRILHSEVSRSQNGASFLFYWNVNNYFY